MTATLGASAYVDVPTYLRAATSQETASLLGLNTTIGGASTAPAGSISLPVATSTNWVAGPLWLLDGPYSEVVQVITAPDGTHLSLAAPGTQFAHAPGVSASQAGAAGALAEMLLRASGWIEGYCQQGAAIGDRSLYAVSRSERWGMPSARASLDRDGVLLLRPGHFPIQSVTALAVELGQGDSLTFDVTQIELPSGGRLIEIPYLLLAGSPTPGQQLILETFGLSRARRQWATVTYTGGVTPGAVPYDLQQAAVWVASDLLAQRRNPSGAAVVRQGKFELQARLRGDATDDSILLNHAKEALEPFRVRAM
ncbi:MAG TPA: hypothetical protein VKQ30_15035 [Ktedonobacterales bacterium]|nr:hypothetical protein [Ktedonobacterales bacterium]